MRPRSVYAVDVRGPLVFIARVTDSIEPCPPVREDIVELLRLRPVRNGRRDQPVAGRLVGFWRSREDWRDPEAGGGYWRAERDAREAASGDAKSVRYLSESDLAPFGGSREAYFEDEADRMGAKAKAHSELPWPGDHVDPSMPQEERERVAALLDSAPLVASYRGCSNDRLAPESRLMNGSGERADAGWIWPTGLSHYVRTYGLVLPPEMIAALEAVRSLVPERVQRAIAEAAGVELSRVRHVSISARPGGSMWVSALVAAPPEVEP